MTTTTLLEIAETTPDHALGRCGGAVLYVWRGATTVPAARRLRRLVDEARAVGEPGVLLGVVCEGASPPDSDARAVLADVLAGGAGFVHSSALVCEGTGFRASMVRAVATGLNLLARPPFPHRVAPSVPTAAEWLERRGHAAGCALYRAEDIVAQVAARPPSRVESSTRSSACCPLLMPRT